MQRQIITSNIRKNINTHKRRRRRYFDYVRPSTSLTHGILSSTNLCNSSDVGILGFVGNPSRGDYLHQGGNSQLQSDLSENEQWTRVVRTMDTDTSCSASTSNTVKSVDSWNSLSESDNKKKPLLTAISKSPLFPESNVRLHLKSEKIFEEDIKCLLDGIELAKSGQLLIESSFRSNPDFYFEKIQHFADDWMRQLLIEKKELDEEVCQAKKKLKVKFDLVSDRLSFLSGVFNATATYMRFTEFQKQAIQSKTKELNAMKRKLIDYEEDNLIVQLNKKDRELIESRLQTDECREELKKTQSELAAQNLKTQLILKDMQNKLREIRSLLIKKSSLNGRSFNLNVDNEQVLKDITDLIEVGTHTHLVNNKDVKIIAENIPGAVKDGSFLKVTENEVHLVTLIASFLKVTPFPVSIEFIYSYVENIDNVVDIQYVENLLKKFPTFFQEVSAVPGSSKSKKNWSYIDLKPVITI